MLSGSVKWFSDSKGYGFIQTDASVSDKDIFAHYTAIAGEGFKTLAEGDKVEFELVDGPRGLHAVNIKRVTTVSQ